MITKKLEIDSKSPYYDSNIVKFAQRIITNPWFDLLVLLTIIVNTMILAIDYDPRFTG